MFGLFGLGFGNLVCVLFTGVWVCFGLLAISGCFGFRWFGFPMI